jgi:hypothetical protein
MPYFTECLCNVKNAEHYYLFLRTSFICCTILCFCSIVECLYRKSNWCCVPTCFFLRLLGGDLLVDRMLPREEVSPGFRTRIIWATFHSAGKYSLSRTTLKSWVRYWIPIVGSSLKIFQVIWSYPGDFFGCMLLMTADGSS